MLSSQGMTFENLVDTILNLRGKNTATVKDWMAWYLGPIDLRNHPITWTGCQRAGSCHQGVLLSRSTSNELHGGCRQCGLASQSMVQHTLNANGNKAPGKITVNRRIPQCS